MISNYVLFVFSLFKDYGNISVTKENTSQTSLIKSF